MKHQLRNKLRENAGFTLVELIVVIAILGILASIGTVGYSGYIERANKSADQQLVGDINYAINLAYVNEPTFNGTQAIVLKKEETAQVIGGDGEFMTNAMTNAFGTGALTNMQLKYGKWGKGAVVAQETLDYFKGVVDGHTDAGLAAVFSGTAVPSFSNDVDDLFTVIRDTAILVNDNRNGSSGAELIKGAANYTTGNMGTSQFAAAWAESVWNNDLISSGEYSQSYIDNHKGDDLFMDSAIANAGVIKARNTALATYLRDNGCPEVYDLFANYSYSGSIIPLDAVGIFLADDTFDSSITEQKNNLLRNIIETGADVDVMLESLNEYYGLDEDGNAVGSREDTQAYKDGLAYYAMMSTVNTVNNEEGASDGTYWDEMAGAVSLYGSIARGETSLDELNSVYESLGDVGEENAVVVTAMASNGKMVVSVSPATAMPG